MARIDIAVRNGPLDGDTGLAPPIGGHYRVGVQIASGGMANVYQALDVRNGSTVALKILHPHLADTELQRDRFKREAAISRRIQHPAMVEVFDAGEDPHSGVSYIAMELVDGLPLSDLMDRGELTQLAALTVLLEVLEPVQRAHALGIVHRDLKPDNILVERESGRARLVDFGIAKQDDAQRRTKTGVGLGTPHYMSPEQARSARSAGAPSDIWSMGVMVYEVVTGRLPFEGETPANVLIAAATTQPVPARTRNPNLNPRLSELIGRCLSHEPGMRPESPATLAAELDFILAIPSVRRSLETKPAVLAPTESAEGMPTTAVSPLVLQTQTGPTQATTQPNGHAAFWRGASAALLLALGVALFLFVTREPATNAAETVGVPTVQSHDIPAPSTSVAMGQTVEAPEPTPTEAAEPADSSASVTDDSPAGHSETSIGELNQESPLPRRRAQSMRRRLSASMASPMMVETEAPTSLDPWDN